MISKGWHEEGVKILVACSGGLDSTVLLSLLHEVQEYELQVIHFNHRLRDVESNDDEAFVRELAKKHELPIHVVSEDIAAIANDQGMSIEETGSIQRKKAYHQVLHSTGYDYVATGHHLDDQMETLVMNLYLGSGVRGVQGTSWEHQGIIRPLLHTTRADLEIYANENKIRFRTDRSNWNTQYLRNKIRHEIIPDLVPENERDCYELVRELTQSGSQLNKLIQESLEHIVNNVVNARSDKKISLGLDKLPNYFSPIQKAVFDRIFQHLSLQRQGLSEKHFSALRFLLSREHISKEVQLPAEIVAVRDRNQLTFISKTAFLWKTRSLNDALSTAFPFFHLLTGEIQVTAHMQDPHYFWLQTDLDKYHIRCLREGDKMIVDRGGRALGLRQILQEAHVATHLKAFFPVLFLNDEIVWVPGVRTAYSAFVIGDDLENQNMKYIKVQYDEGTFE